MRVAGLVTSSALLTLLKARDTDAGSDDLAAVDNVEPKGDDADVDEEESGRLKLTLLVILEPEDALAFLSPSPSLPPAILVINGLDLNTGVLL